MGDDAGQEAAFTIAEVAEAIAADRYQWQAHAAGRALARALEPDDVHRAICSGTIIEHYPKDQPLPSALVLGYNESVPVHAVVAYDAATCETFVITVYVPDADHFEGDHRTRRCRTDDQSQDPLLP